MDLVSREDVLKCLFFVVTTDPKASYADTDEQIRKGMESIRERIESLPSFSYTETNAFKLRLIKFILEDEVEDE